MAFCKFLQKAGGGGVFAWRISMQPFAANVIWNLLLMLKQNLDVFLSTGLYYQIKAYYQLMLFL